MKSTYRLVGTFWDGKAALDKMPSAEPFDATIGATNTPDSLFDQAGKRRYVRLSNLLACDDDKSLGNLLESLSCARAVYVALDWQPASSNPTLVSFFDLRVRQILAELNSRLPSCQIVPMSGGLLRPSVVIHRMTIPWLIQMAEGLEAYLIDQGMKFDEQGFPLVPPSCYAKAIPREMLPYTHRRSRLCASNSNAAICFFMDDHNIYPRFEHLFEEVGNYRSFASVVVPDLSVTADMDVPWQGFIMLLNQLFGAVLAVNGIKIIANTRCGSTASLRYLEAIPKGILCASGSLGCKVLVSKIDYGFLSKLLSLRPSASLIYGKEDPIAFEQFATMGIPVKRYPDIHSRSINASQNKNAA